MPIVFQQPQRVLELVEAVERLVATTIMPLEESVSGVIASGSEAVRNSLQEAARAAGVFAPMLRWTSVDLVSP